MHHATGWDAICLIALLVFCAYVAKMIIHKPTPSYAALAARVAELEAEREKIGPALQIFTGAIGNDLRRYTDILDAQWPGWRKFADERNASGS